MSTDSYRTVAAMGLPRWRPVVDVALVVVNGVRRPAQDSFVFRARQRAAEWIAPPMPTGATIRIMLTPAGKVVVR